MYVFVVYTIQCVIQAGRQFIFVRSTASLVAHLTWYTYVMYMRLSNFRVNDGF